ncbi:hypothetical protein ADL29_12150 [Streptomyces chattanoogensis]|uniref:Uncharacterized protein n=1 Tax=Streptomyces chattanoogensis TaxID=66876 RepID=A0A0N0XZS8_9ACTN|nr:hypothetical protein ADL29_12150 [Streptomyces chattanoogensis]
MDAGGVQALFGEDRAHVGCHAFRAAKVRVVHIGEPRARVGREGAEACGVEAAFVVGDALGRGAAVDVEYAEPPTEAVTALPSERCSWGESGENEAALGSAWGESAA